MPAFKSKYGSTLAIESHDDDSIFIDLNNPDAIFSHADAPAIALAVLEAAGIKASDLPESTSINLAAYYLREHIGVEAANANAAAEQAELEVEALELLNAFRADSGLSPHSCIEDMPASSRASWLAAARRARELYRGADA